MHPRRTRGVRRASAAGVAIALAAGLVACSDDDDATADPPPESTSTATDEAGGDETDTEEAVPELPPEAQGDDDAAAVAFVEHWVELLNYAIATGNTEPVRAVTDPACQVCEPLFIDLEDGGGSGDSSSWTLTRSEARSSLDSDPEPAERVVDSGVDTTGEGETGQLLTGVSRDGDAWVLDWMAATRT